MKRGRPAAEFSPQQVEIARGLVLQGITMEVVAKALGVTAKTLRKHLGGELNEVKQQCTARVIANLLRMATGSGKEAVTAAIFYLKTQANWKETAALEMSGPDGKPMDNVLRVEFVEAK